jgi:hypothetical protein
MPHRPVDLLIACTPTSRAGLLASLQLARGNESMDQMSSVGEYRLLFSFIPPITAIMHVCADACGKDVIDPGVMSRGAHHVLGHPHSHARRNYTRTCAS